MIIEVTGIPRAGKTTFVQRVFTHWKVFGEAFDRVPFEKDEHDAFNLYYARYVHELVATVHASGSTDCVIERGPFDRIAFARALHEYGLLSTRARDEHETLLFSDVHRVDHILYFDVSVDESLARDAQPPDPLTGERAFLDILARSYDRLAEQTRTYARIHRLTSREIDGALHGVIPEALASILRK